MFACTASLGALQVNNFCFDQHISCDTLFVTMLLAVYMLHTTLNCDSVPAREQPWEWTYLEGGSSVEGRGAAEPSGGTAEVGVPGLVDEAGGGCPGLGLPQVVEAIGCLRIQPHTEVVVEQSLHLPYLALSMSYTLSQSDLC